MSHRLKALLCSLITPAAMAAVVVAAPAAHAQDFTVFCAWSDSALTNPIESYQFVPAPAPTPVTTTRTHLTSYNNCTGTVSSGTAATGPITATASCTQPFPLTAIETVTYIWNNAQTSTVEYTRVATVPETSGGLIRFRQTSTGTVTAGAGLGEAVTRRTLFDPVAGCGGAATSMFGRTDEFRLG